jgi:hypothetical protein
VQTRFAYQQGGLVRRTTARNDNGEWVVITLWRTGEDARAATERWRGDGDAAELMSLVDPTSLRSEQFDTLD